ncbi:hypothetical protein A2U01_0060052, partial [Trifolium medium]|nr:hypothetical protein [Trifolium medium]
MEAMKKKVLNSRNL